MSAPDWVVYIVVSGFGVGCYVVGRLDGRSDLCRHERGGRKP